MIIVSSVLSRKIKFYNLDDFKEIEYYEMKNSVADMVLNQSQQYLFIAD